MARKRPPAPPPPPESELEILVLLHERGEMDTNSVREALQRFRPITHASISTLLRRLEMRGLVTRRKGEKGKTFLYSATVPADVTYKGVIARLLDRVFHDDPAALVSTLLSVRPPTDAEARELRSMVDRLQTRRKKP
ncbi:MAG: BlaI/MecI/CopY family transcriptional regulator [Acidobacteriota bacterium]